MRMPDRNRKQKESRALRVMVILLLTLFCSLAVVASAEAKSLAFDPIREKDGYSTVLYNNRNGLPTSEANDIVETSEGFIWIGSYSGLIRYDGNTFDRIDSTTGIASVVSLYVDSEDRLWIGTNDNGLVVMEKGEFRFWDQEDGLQSNSVRSITGDADGNIYAGTTSGVAIIDGKKMTLRALEDERIAGAYIRSMHTGSDGRIYGLTQDGGIFALKNGVVDSWHSEDEMGVKGVIGFLPDPQEPGSLFLGTEKSEIYHGSLDNNFETVRTYDISPLSYVETLRMIDDQLWICAGNGIGVLEGETFYHLNNLAMDNSVERVITDYQGNLWFTSTRQGVMKVVQNRFSDLFKRYDLPERVVNSTAMLDGQLFVATDDGLLVIGEQGPLETLPLTKAETASGQDMEATDLLALLDRCRIRSLIRDSRDRLWIATWRKYGLLRYDHGELTAFTTEEGLFSDRVRVSAEREDGSMLAACTGGVVIIRDDEVIGSYGTEAEIVNKEILTVVEGENGDILLGSDGGGIYVVQKDGIRHIGLHEGLESEVVMRIKKDERNRVYWIITSNSVAFMTMDYKVQTVQKFPYSNNFDLYENSKGDIWMLSSNGIYVTPSAEMIANGEIRPAYYGLDNGLSCCATANSYSELTENGDLYIAGNAGVTVINIEEPVEDLQDLKLTVPYVDVDGERLYPNAEGGFEIPSSTRRLTIYSHVYNYSLINPQVSYHLEGFEQNDTTTLRSNLVPINYTNLRGGDYAFVMQLKDALGRGNKTVSVPIRKDKAFTEEIWFIVLVGVVLLLCLIGVVRFYIRRKTKALMKKQQENATFVREITEAFAKVIDMKDSYTNGHSSRVANYTAMLAEEMGFDRETVEKYYRIALLHDIGKVGVPQEVLNKPGKLTDEEFEIIKSHASKGYDALKNISIMPELSIGAGAHHERPDGRGYPNHLQGTEIPMVARIIAVADCFDAMYSDRPYRKRMNFDKAVSIVREVSGTQLSTEVVDAFLRLVEKGKFRAEDDYGGGTMESIDNIRKKSE